jgi:2-dehydro-3-deoxyphosphogluconate aldolase/(4S)-4-hydroxy-2-oxoglutarate aldolase
VHVSNVSQVVEWIRAGGILAIVRLTSTDDFLPAIEAIREGGVRAVEWSLGEPERLRALEAARARLGRNLVIGAGTILTANEAKDAIRAGAQFLVAPTLNPEVLRVGLEREVAVILGAFTATEIAKAWELGAGLVKLFPAGSVGPAYVRDLRGPLSYVPLIPSGGVTLENVGPFIQAGAAAVGVGNALVPRDLVTRRAFADITALARAFVDAVHRARDRADRPVPAVKPVESPDTR